MEKQYLISGYLPPVPGCGVKTDADMVLKSPTGGQSCEDEPQGHLFSIAQYPRNSYLKGV